MDALDLTRANTLDEAGRVGRRGGRLAEAVASIVDVECRIALEAGSPRRRRRRRSTGARRAPGRDARRRTPGRRRASSPPSRIAWACLPAIARSRSPPEASPAPGRTPTSEPPPQLPSRTTRSTPAFRRSHFTHAATSRTSSSCSHARVVVHVPAVRGEDAEPGGDEARHRVVMREVDPRVHDHDAHARRRRRGRGPVKRADLPVVVGAEGERGHARVLGRPAEPEGEAPPVRFGDEDHLPERRRSGSEPHG